MDSGRGRFAGVPIAGDRTATAAGMPKKLQAARLRLCVRLDNIGAIRLYEQEGYVRLGMWTKYYSDGGDALVMDKIR